ncbi:MAG: hypothetical protein KGH64_01160 [Candidatus Micrarchaeota archaeon]|nr:hypothetical protein [Candidatus Micrarchaeota archaeon]MDE1833926.1 hypothetical protein [Candidatus Micrarchaeota archaeon]MDE1859798.1 hypothetical protein [Candidatus Micrarchaeota archaeon]
MAFKKPLLSDRDIAILTEKFGEENIMRAASAFAQGKSIPSRDAAERIAHKFGITGIRLSQIARQALQTIVESSLEEQYELAVKFNGKGSDELVRTLRAQALGSSQEVIKDAFEVFRKGEQGWRGPRRGPFKRLSTNRFLTPREKEFIMQLIDQDEEWMESELRFEMRI